MCCHNASSAPTWRPRKRPKTERDHYADALAEQHRTLEDALAHAAYVQVRLRDAFAVHQANMRESADRLRQATKEL